MIIYLLTAVAFLCVGHIIKSLRWKKIISIYEDVSTSKLLLSMSVGQAINMLIPFRLGDLYRIWYVGKKELRNGCILSAATVFVDIFIDVITVGMAFFTLFVLKIHRTEVLNATVHYGAVSLIAVVSVILAVTFKTYVKSSIGKIASLFNTKMERRILMVCYTIFASMKDLLKLKNILRVILYTAGVWMCYFFSYAEFAIFLQGKGYDFTLTRVFNTIFSMAGDALLWECMRVNQRTILIWFLIYLTVPLLLIIVTLAAYSAWRVEYNAVARKKIQIIPQVNESDKLEFLNLYFKDKKRDFFEAYLFINKDVIVLKDCSAGSNATTILAMNDQQTFYRKYAFGADAKKLHEQVLWLKTFQDKLPLCNIISEKYTGETCCYDMPYENNSIGYFEYIHESSRDSSWNILKDVLESLEEGLYEKKRNTVNDEALDKYIAQKVLQNIAVCEEWCSQTYPALFDSEMVVINGVCYHNLQYFKKQLSKESLHRIFANDPISIIHGDLTIENIVCVNDENHRWYLIDPNPGTVHETPFLDYAKLLQSLHGQYEFLMMVNDVHVESNQVQFFFTGSIAYWTLYENYKRYLFTHFTGSQVKSIFYHEAIHWLRLMPYKIRKNPQGAVIFYAGMLIVLNDIEKMFG